MDPNIWGPKFWFSLHSTTLTYPFYPDEKDKLRYKNFFELLEFVLPCALCRNNYAKNLKQYPITNHLNDRKSLVYWLIDIHNMVNVETQKPTISHSEVIEMYEKIYGRKIYLEDPEPHLRTTKLDDSPWQKQRQKINKRRMNNIKAGSIFGAALLLAILLLLIVFLMNK